MIQALLTSLACLTLAYGSAAASKPNIVLIFADDLGWQEPGFAGSDFLETPRLDQLAREGMVFRHAYASAGNCQPSRACMLSGQYTPRHGVYAVGSTDRGPKTLMRMIPVPNRPNLPPDTMMLGESLKAAGYATGFFGKCHMKDSKTGKSEHAGFDVIQHSKPGLNSDDPADPKAIFSITNAACEFIEANRERPFFAYIPHYAVHARLEGRAETQARFKDKPPGRLGHGHAMLGACLADMDTGIGTVLDKLKALGLEENTLVVFTSDHGDCAGAHRFNQKTVFYDESARVPLVIACRGRTAGSTTDELVNTGIDLLPTMLDFAGLAIPAKLPGRSLLPLVFGQPVDAWRDYVVAENNMTQTGEIDGLRPQMEGRMVRTDRYKYCVFSHGQRRESLVDMQADPGETTDLAADPKYRPVLLAHRELLQKFAREHSDPLVAKLLADDVKPIPFSASDAPADPPRVKRKAKSASK